MEEPRVVSLLASATEIVAALGHESSLVGRSHECDFPPSVASLPVLSRPLVDTGEPSREIDRRVRAAAAGRHSIYAVDTDTLEALRPDLVITQSQCEVCAVSPRDFDGGLCEWTGIVPEVVSLTPDSLDGVRSDFRKVARAIGDEESGEKLVAEFDRRMDEVRAVWQKTGRERPSVVCLEWIDPLMTAGNWIPELVEIAGAFEVLGTSGERSRVIEWEELRVADPDVIVLMPCGFDRPRTLEEAVTLGFLPGWGGLKAVRSGRVYAVDANSFFTRPGPRLADSAEQLATLLWR